MYTPLLSPIHAACPAHLILLDFFTRTIFGEQYRPFCSSLCSFLHSPVTSSLLGPHYHPRTFISTPQVVIFVAEVFVVGEPLTRNLTGREDQPLLHHTQPLCLRGCSFNSPFTNLHHLWTFCCPILHFTPFGWLHSLTLTPCCWWERHFLFTT